MVVRAFSTLLSKKNIFRSHYSKQHRYNYIFDHFSHKEAYFDLLKRIKNKHHITNQPIGLLKHKPFNKTTIFDIQKRYGNPHYEKVSNILNRKVTICVYKIIFGGHKVRLSVHFCNDSLFYFSFTFPYLTSEKRKYINQMFRKKYNLSSSFNVSRDYIKDKQKVIAFYEESVDITLHYLYLDSCFLNKTKMYFSRKENFINLKRKCDEDELLGKI